ncbi:unnamed protein product [Discosporangium mesarthrocarpum]
MKYGTGVYLHPAENNPKPPRAQNKRSIKYMFLAAVAWPRKTCNGVRVDGKIGICSFVDTVLDSNDRKKGSPIMKLATVNGERYKKLMIEEVIPAIKARMPRPPGHTIFVQQDGAKPHTGKGVMEAIQDASGDNIILET